MSSSFVEPVLLIHGTFANKRSKDDASDWWHPGSDFCRELDAALAKEGSIARCWAQLRDGASGGDAGHGRAPFAWTGENSEFERRRAGRALAAVLEALEADPTVRAYHLVGHSHGGNVILHALRAMTRPGKLGAVVYMGTPTLVFRHREAFDVRWLAVPLYVGALGGGLWAYGHWPDDKIIWGTVVGAVALALGADLFFSPSRQRRADSELYGSGYARAFAFEIDEAITSLRAAQGIACDPRRFIDQFTQSQSAPDPAFAPTQAPTTTFSSRMQGTGAYALLQALLSRPDVPGYLPPAAAGGALRAEETPSRAAFRAVAQTLERGSQAFPFNFIVIVVLWICVLLPLLVMIAAGAIYSGLAWLAGGIVAAVVVGGARKLGQIALPVLVRKAALGADSGRFIEVLECPPGALREPMSEELCAQAAAVSGRFGHDTGQVMLQAIANKDPFAIKSRVTDALTNTALAHSYYYQAGEVRAKIARLIAVRPAGTGAAGGGLRFISAQLPFANQLKGTAVPAPSPPDRIAPPRS